MTYEQRVFVMTMYKGLGWKTKVAKMSDHQVFAIYKSEQKKIEEKKLAEKKQKKTQDNNDIPF